jgi:hypothetical protein
MPGQAVLEPQKVPRMPEIPMHGYTFVVETINVGATTTARFR